MSLQILIVIGVLVYISYQLYQLNLAKKSKLSIRQIEKDEEKIKEIMPHLYKSGVNPEIKRKVKLFLEEYPYHKYKADDMRILATEEKDPKKKEKMNAVLKDMVEYTVQYRNEVKATEYEIQFVIWTYLNEIYDIFPGVEGVDLRMSNFIEPLGFKDLLLKK